MFFSLSKTLFWKTNNNVYFGCLWEWRLVKWGPVRLRDGAGSSWTFVVSHPKNNYVVRSRQRGKRVYLLTVRVIIKSFHICFKKNKILVAVVLVSGLIRSGLVITCLQVYTSNSVGLVTANLVRRRRRRKGTMTMMRSFSMAMLLVALVSSISIVSSASSSPEAEFVQKTISSHKIVIFSKSYCPYVPLSLPRSISVHF